LRLHKSGFALQPLDLSSKVRKLGRKGAVTVVNLSRLALTSRAMSAKAATASLDVSRVSVTVRRLLIVVTTAAAMPS